MHFSYHAILLVFVLSMIQYLLFYLKCLIVGGLGVEVRNVGSGGGVENMLGNLG